MDQVGDNKDNLDRIHNLIQSSWNDIPQLHDLVSIMELAISPEKGSSDNSKTSPIYWGPSLALHCCQAGGGQIESALPVAAAWLLYYIAAHTYDAIVDNDIPDPWWEELGVGPALNVATGLIFTASYLLDGLKNQRINTESVNKIIRDFYIYLLKACAGQHRDLITEQPTLDQWWLIAQGKAGIPFSLACRTGARVGTTNESIIDSLTAYGLHVGMMLQISDDAIELRRLINNELTTLDHNFWKSLPIVYAMEVLPDSDQHELVNNLRLSLKDKAATARAIEIISNSGSDLYLRTQLQTNRILALKALDHVRDTGNAWRWLESLVNDVFPEHPM